MSRIIGISSLQYVHVLDLNTNISRVEKGPQTVVLESNEQLIAGPLPMIVIPPAHYCIVKDPMSKYVHRKSCQLKLGQYAIKFHSEPFCLFPGETLIGADKYAYGQTSYSGAIKPQPVIAANSALRLRAVLDHHDDTGVDREAGDIWQLEGPFMYFPTESAEIVSQVEPVVIGVGTALRLRALQAFKDKFDKKRVTGEEWMVTKPGAYIPGVCEEVVKVEKKITLTVDTGLRLRAQETMVDRHGTTRLAGEEWLLTGEHTDEYFPEIGVEVVAVEQKKVLKQGQYCVVVDPVDAHLKPRMGRRELRRGCSNFFLHPGERLEKGIQNNYILAEDEAIVLQATENYVDVTDKGKVKRKCGERWMICGATEYIPPIEVRVVTKRKRIPLSKNEGIYVQDRVSGKVRAEMGPQAYMLSENEEHWEKELSPIVEEMLKKGGGTGSDDIRKMAYFEQSVDPQFLKGRNKTRVVQFRCPGNTALQINNYLDKTDRIVFGPDLVILEPHENFNILSLSAGKPKVAGAMKSLCLMLGPDFISDILEVETSDHARLRLEIAFNNHFEYEIGNPESEAKIFSVPDFIGFACRQIGSMIRAAVALIAFDEFHKNSAQVIQSAAFWDAETGKMQPQLKFKANSLVISSIDIKSIEPVDRKMRDSLSKSVQLAIEISTSSIEAAARQEAFRNEQISVGHLERQKLINEMDSEKERCKLLELRSVTAAIESTGQAKAESYAQAEKMLIECGSEIEAARLKAEAGEIEHQTLLETQAMLKSNELSYMRNQNNLELAMAKGMADVEVQKFADMVDAIGTDTLTAIARAGPESQVKLLEGLGVEATLFTDGDSPINLFNTAHGLIGSSGTA